MSHQVSVYLITNTVNGMQYVGVSNKPVYRFHQHARHSLKSKSIIKNAIMKYGVENFKLEVLLHAERDYCYEMEKKIIEAYNTRKPNGYNICTGGLGANGLFGELNGMYGRRGAAHPHFGKPGYSTGVVHSAETKEKMRKAHLGQKRSAENKERMRQIALNRSPELLAKMNEARKAAFQRKKEARK